MNAETFAEWLQRQGHKVIKTNSSYWYSAGPRVFQAFPYNWIISPPKEELDQIMMDHGALALRYSTSLNADEGMVSYHVVLKRPYNLETLTTKLRYNIRQGLKNTKIEKISFKQMATDGWVVVRDTLQRQGRANSMTPKEWEKICLSAEDLPGFECWGGFVDGELASTLFTVCIDNIGYTLYANTLQKHLKTHVSNAIYYVATTELLSREGITEMFFSLHSLDAPESINAFKFNMNFDALPVRQRVVFHPIIQPFVNNVSQRIMSTFIKYFPDNNLFRKTEGMLRFYLEGKKPLDEQIWPSCISDWKQKVIE